MRRAIGAKALMDGVIVAVVHDEFRGMGHSGVSGFMGAGAVVVNVMGMIDRERLGEGILLYGIVNYYHRAGDESDTNL